MGCQAWVGCTVHDYVCIPRPLASTGTLMLIGMATLFTGLTALVVTLKRLRPAAVTCPVELIEFPGTENVLLEEIPQQ